MITLIITVVLIALAWPDLVAWIGFWHALLLSWAVVSIPAAIVAANFLHTGKGKT